MVVETSEGFCRHSSFQPSTPPVLASRTSFCPRGHSQLEPSPIPSSQPNPVLEPQDSRLWYQRATITDHQKFLFFGDFFFLCDISAFISCIPESTPAHCHQLLNLVSAAGSKSSSGIHATITSNTHLQEALIPRTIGSPMAR